MTVIATKHGKFSRADGEQFELNPGDVVPQDMEEAALSQGWGRKQTRAVKAAKAAMNEDADGGE